MTSAEEREQRQNTHHDRKELCFINVSVHQLKFVCLFIASYNIIPLHSKLLKQYLQILSYLGIVSTLQFYRVFHLFPGVLPQLCKSKEMRMDLGINPAVYFKSENSGKISS